ncbi:hypothetical protein EYZ11_007016 [Aspergillus tanneri]|uniref:NAD(P)-binding domain-containing protein n=1 Tax=Aspergillus tanneri TaxID=1220188 RepID=A0A4S3JEB6_9EURO|nr:uncharacterized protein ATNIH1004_010721 [Aspergillus tanneri]KAA8641782.1 hypothetical protein ATNIH1004_010721 [Aspergillus tanneri]THC93492.1 hypothetical protein EYZ11_007016 [Aspergillus tanneri]
MPKSTTTAFLGATGGCVNACLAHSLRNGYPAVALARSPSKLTSLLLTQSLDQETLDAQLRIVQGDATDPRAVKSTLLQDIDGDGNGDDDGGNYTVVSKIISGIGGSGTFRNWGLEFDNPHICEDSTQALLTALRQIYLERPSLIDTQPKPLLTVISGMGIDPNKRREDVPFLLRWPYHALLHVPHADKWRMEEILCQEDSKSLFRGIVTVRPGSLLTGDHLITSGNGWKTVQVGTESGKPAVGYKVLRADVGEWMFNEVVVEGGERWMGEKVSLTS